MPPTEFRFRPRFLALASLVAGAGGILFVAGIRAGVIGPLIAAGYFLSPAWRLRVVVDDEALSVARGAKVRFRLPWSDVVRVVCVPLRKVCFVDGGDPGRSLLVPGPDAPGPYRIERREELYDFILARVPRERVTEVERLHGGGRADTS